MTAPQQIPAALADYLVVDLSSGIAGAYCTKLLADGGARVFKVEAPAGDPLRQWSASGATIAQGDDGALFSFLASSKHSVVADPHNADDVARVRELLLDADAVVWSSGSPLAEMFHPVVLQREMPHLTITSITPFGLHGPWSDRAATEFTLQAWSGGIVGLGRGSPDRAPVFVGGQIGEWLAGVYGAIGTMAARWRGLRDGVGELVDLSMLETLALCLTYYPVSFHETVGRPFRVGRSIVSPGVEATSDGIVGVGVGTGQQWLDFCVMVGHPEWMQDRSLFAKRGHLQPEIAAWMSEHTTQEVLELAALLRIPHAPIGNGATIPHTDHFRERGSVVTNIRDGFDQPDRPYRFTPSILRAPEPAPHLGEHQFPEPPRRKGQPTTPAGELPQHAPLSGMRVLDLTAFWAGPLSTHVVAMLGAEVIHVESTARPDGTRLLSGLRFSEPDWWEQSGIFTGLNTSKLGVTLDLGHARGSEVLGRLIATCDVIVENYTPRVLEQLGFDEPAIRAIRPDVILVRMPGFGLDGPWRDDPAFAFVIEDASGLTWMTGYRDQNPISPYCVGDSNAGIHAACALLLAVEHRRRTGQGLLVEASMVDAALNIAAEQIIEYSAYGNLLERAGNRGPTAAPQNIYLCSGTWVAIAVATNTQWLALCGALDNPDWALDPRLATAAGRLQHHDAIDAELAQWCAARDIDEVVATLWDAGVPVAKVMQPHEQTTLEQLHHRGFFEVVERPVSGTARHSTLPFRLSRGPQRFHRSPAPLLGQHTEQILLEIGFTDAEIQQMHDDGISGRVPDIARR